MSLSEFFASRTERRRRSAQQSYEEGAQLRRRLQELLGGVPTPRQTVETPFTNDCSEINSHNSSVDVGNHPATSATIESHPSGPFITRL
jgi:hypothetical protein